MKPILLNTCRGAVVLLLTGLCQSVFAQGAATLSERLMSAAAQQGWKVAYPFRGQSTPTASLDGVLEGEGYSIRLALSVHASYEEAEAYKTRTSSMSITAMPPSPLTTASRYYRKANVIIVIIADSDLSAGAQATSADIVKRQVPAVIVDKVSRVIDDLILADVRFDACVNELFPDTRPIAATRIEAFFRDVEAGCLPRVETALADGIDANTRNETGSTPLMHAVTAGRREVARFLLSAGADPNAVVGATGPPIFRVFSRPGSYYADDLPRILDNQLAILDDLLVAGAELDVRNEKGRTLLLETAKWNADDGSPKICLKGLMERGAGVSIRDKDGRTAVILAVMHTHPKVNLETLPILLDAGVDVNTQDSSGKTALDYAREKADQYKHDDWGRVMRLLTDAGAKPW